MAESNLDPAVLQQLQEKADSFSNRMNIGKECLDRNCVACVRERQVTRDFAEGIYRLALSTSQEKVETCGHPLATLTSCARRGDSPMSPFTRIYDVLVKDAGASESERERFIAAHLDQKHEVREWRFCGSLGFGGKFWIQRMAVTCYSEDETPERRATMKRTNAALKILEGETPK